jgi:hypothetical protein
MDRWPGSAAAHRGRSRRRPRASCRRYRTSWSGRRAAIVLRRACQEAGLDVGGDLLRAGRDRVVQALADRGVDSEARARMHPGPDPDRRELCEQQTVSRRRREDLELITARIEECDRILTGPRAGHGVVRRRADHVLGPAGAVLAPPIERGEGVLVLDADHARRVRGVRDVGATDDPHARVGRSDLLHAAWQPAAPARGGHGIVAGGVAHRADLGEVLGVAPRGPSPRRRADSGRWNAPAGPSSTNGRSSP